MAHLPGLLAFVLQSQSYQSPIPLIVLVLTIIGAVVDYKYKKAGGQRPSKSDRIFMLVVTLFVFGLIASLYTVNVAIAGMAAVPLMLFLLFAWEVGRWRMRRKYPLPKPEADIAKTG